MILLMFLSSLVAALVSMAWSLACVVLRPASGILLWLLSVIPLRRRALRSAEQLEDGREYEFDHGRGHRCRRTYFWNPLHAKIDEREAFTLAVDCGTGIAGVQCWQKRFPNGDPCPGTGCWMPLGTFFGPRNKGSWGARLVPLKKGASPRQPRGRRSVALPLCGMLLGIAAVVVLVSATISTG